MSCVRNVFRICTVVLMMGCHLGVANGGWYMVPGNKVKADCQIVVDPSGYGNFSSIQSAIDNVPSNNKKWVCIFVKAGIYREKVEIPYDKPFIILKGERKKSTRVIWDDHDSLAETPTFASFADNIVVKKISFVNGYNYPIGNNRNQRKAAVAAMVAGDKTSFYRCVFSGLQDTLWDVYGRHYFSKCTIEGAVDFIFGDGQSIYEDCQIRVLGKALEPGLVGFITAQGRSSPTEPSGFVFKGGRVRGKGSAFLGRPWRDFARVLFYNVNLSDVVDPKGWEAWQVSGRENQLTFAEYGCYGNGADTSQRVSWATKLRPNTVNQFTSYSFIDADGWLQKQPI